MKNVLLLTIVMFLLTGHRSSDSNELEKDQLIAVWVHSRYNSDGIEFVKGKRFKKACPGLEFKKNGNLIKRQNVGWCGTPPVTYGNFNGTWEFTSDSTLRVNYEFWGGTDKEDWRIIELNAHKLKIEPIARRTPDE